ncbi:hypothetical protein [Candidatus Magnetomonas plexicatena]|uniref:hypothetical protein n=1 Tax=Candidatus Magnetomonas plexicatena TaxID=2552947 RepID=UPI001C7514F8|nr:hypothetical protein E2O03_000275 [Nitrospirales bacterium LBB_01]
MKRKSLYNTNPYLKDTDKCWEYFVTSVNSSCAIEGISVTEEESWAIVNSIKKRQEKPSKCITKSFSSSD